MHSRWRKQRLMIGLFVFAVFAQALLGIVSLDLVSSARAFVGGESLWSKAQRNAVLHLRAYIATHAEADYRAFLDAVAVTRGDRSAREELDRRNPDPGIVARGFAQGGIQRDDIPGMSRLYRWGHATPLMSEAVATWVQADAGIDELSALMTQARSLAADAPPGRFAELSAHALALDTRLTQLEQRFSEELGAASRQTVALLIVVNLILAAGLSASLVIYASRSNRAQRKVEAALEISARRWELAAHAANLGVFDWLLAEHRIQFDARAARLIGLDAQAVAEADPQSLRGAIHPDDLARVQAAIDRALAEGDSLRVRCRLRMPGGTIRNLDITGDVHDTEHKRMVGLLRDVDDEVRAEEAIHRQAARQGLVATFGQFALANPDLDALLAEAEATARAGLDAELSRLLVRGEAPGTLRIAAGAGWSPEWKGDHVYDEQEEHADLLAADAPEALVVDDYASARRAASSPALRAHDVRSAAVTTIRGASGPFGLLAVYSRQARRFDDESASFLQSIAHTLAAAVDRRHAEDRLAKLARFDALTALPNRRTYLDQLALTIDQTRRRKELSAVLFIDVDRFKQVNDTLGHAVGDAVLQQVAHRLHASVRQADFVGRLGGDEFAVTLTQLGRPEDAARVARKIISAVGSPLQIDGHEVSVSASVGIAVWPGDGDGADALLNSADTAMYRAKHAGRNGYRFHQAGMNERLQERATIETELRHALDRGEFQLRYQPRADLASGEISGLEAALHWAHPERGLLAPGDFQAELEESGLSVPVGEWVIAEACRQLAEWRAAGVVARPTAIGLSARQLADRGLEGAITGILDSTGVDPRLLEFEVAESALMNDRPASVRTLGVLRTLGVRISVDRVGIGHSSLAHLKRLAPDCLKIDRSFIRGVTTDPDDSMLAIAIINLARSLGLRVVAEGVETDEQVA
ncbi:MAG: EAL domain-containing protein, partial [Burkholderiales bacterium]|nr:EAL domain-containing protein [Burkholderiales bacterium]